MSVESPTLQDVETYCYQLDGVNDRIKQLETEKERYRDLIITALGRQGVDRAEIGPFRPKMMYPEPRKTINAEKLLAAGVRVEIIQAATEETPQAPYLRVDKIKMSEK